MLEALAEELRKPEYAGLSDEQTAAAVNNKLVLVREVVPTWKVKQHAIENGYYAAIALASDNPLCVNVIAWIDDQAGKIQSLDMDAAATIAMTSGLVQAGLMTESQKASLLALADVTKKWVDYVGIGEVGIGYVRAARLM
jgi:hypothetical protein